MSSWKAGLIPVHLTVLWAYPSGPFLWHLSNSPTDEKGLDPVHIALVQAQGPQALILQVAPFFWLRRINEALDGPLTEIWSGHDF